MAATPFSCIRTSPVSPVICSASPLSNHPKNDPSGQKQTPTSNWWTPLFGWSSDPDYIVQGTDNGNPVKGESAQPHSKKDIGGTARSKFSVVCFTEEKAKELRRKTTETSTFHDIMYHSAIASRLASDVSDSGRRER